jgi:hypothetical protein
VEIWHRNGPSELLPDPVDADQVSDAWHASWSRALDDDLYAVIDSTVVLVAGTWNGIYLRQIVEFTVCGNPLKPAETRRWSCAIEPEQVNVDGSQDPEVLAYWAIDPSDQAWNDNVPDEARIEERT